uniref:Uncharacterized protein n=1 Tax=Rhizophora mucronata TaxID=61149 RepID=A0A2P2Q4J4_RHIMU
MHSDNNTPLLPKKEKTQLEHGDTYSVSKLTCESFVKRI